MAKRANVTDPEVTTCGFPPPIPATKKYVFLKSQCGLENKNYCIPRINKIVIVKIHAFTDTVTAALAIAAHILMLKNII